MRTIETKVYQYSELSPGAQSKARDWYRSGPSMFHADPVLDDAATIGALLGFSDLRVYYTGFSSQGDGACFDANWRAADVDLAGLRAYAPQDSTLHEIGEEFARIAADVPDMTFSVKHSGRYYHEYCTLFDFGPDTLAPHELTLMDLSRRFMRWIYRALESDYQAQTADDNIAEILEINGFEFTADGVRYG